MNPNNQTIPDDEIDLREIILTLWKEKYLILIITLFFAVAGYFYGTLQPKAYQTTITLRDAPVSIFKKYELFIATQQQQQQEQQISIASNFNKEFELNLMSFDNLINFVEQNKKIDEFKSYLKINNIETRVYFRDKLKPVTDKKNELTSQYVFNFSIPLLGTEFLNDYIIFTKQVSVDQFKEQLKEIIKNEIKIYDQNLEIAKTINLENPVLKSIAEGNSVVNMPKGLFYKGSKVLSKQKHYLEKLLKETDNFDLNYNPILEQAFNSKLLTKSPSIFTAIAFVLGLFFSFVVIFVRSIFAT